jgi:hypothetical protein
MLASTDDGRCRTEAEHARLLTAAGLRLVREIPGGPGEPSLLEARRA